MIKMRMKGKKVEVTVPLRTPKVFANVMKAVTSFGFTETFEITCPVCSDVYETIDPRSSLLCDKCNEGNLL